MWNKKIDSQFQHNLENLDEPWFGQTNQRIDEIIGFEGDPKNMDEVTESTNNPQGIRTFFSGIDTDLVIIHFVLIDNTLFFTKLDNFTK